MIATIPPGTVLDKTNVEIVARKLGCATKDLTIIHGKGLSKRAFSLINEGVIEMAIRDDDRRHDSWSAVAA